MVNHATNQYWVRINCITAENEYAVEENECNVEEFKCSSEIFLMYS